MNFLRLAYYIFFSFNLKTETNKNVLSKAKDKDERSFLLRITPYIILLMAFILLVLVLWVMIAHGQSVTGTEANIYYNGELA